MPEIVNIDESRYDQNTYVGRAKHFFVTTNPLNILASNKQLEDAKQLVESYRQTKALPANVSVDQLWQAKYLMDSAFHPDTKEKMFFLGRMSCQVPANLVITAGMLTWYKTTAGKSENLNNKSQNHKTKIINKKSTLRHCFLANI